jgi:hypothetical protein
LIAAIITFPFSLEKRKGKTPAENISNQPDDKYQRKVKSLEFYITGMTIRANLGCFGFF